MRTLHSLLALGVLIAFTPSSILAKESEIHYFVPSVSEMMRLAS